MHSYFQGRPITFFFCLFIYLCSQKLLKHLLTSEEQSVLDSNQATSPNIIKHSSYPQSITYSRFWKISVLNKCNKTSFIVPLHLQCLEITNLREGFKLYVYLNISVRNCIWFYRCSTYRFVFRSCSVVVRTLDKAYLTPVTSVWQPR